METPVPRPTPLVPIQLDRERHLCLTNRAKFTIETEMIKLWGRKVSLFTMLTETDLMTINDLAICVWQGLLHEDPTLTLPQVQDLMDFDHMGDYMLAVLQAWNAASAAAQPGQEVNGEAHAPFPATSTGPPSGAMAVSTLA